MKYSVNVGSLVTVYMEKEFVIEADNEEEAFEIAEQQFREDCNNSSTYIDCDEIRVNEIEKIEEGE